MKYISLFFAIAMSSCHPPTPSLPLEKTSYYIPISFSKFSAIQAPCLDVQLEGQTFSLELDLGFQGELTIDQEQLDLLSSKTFLRNAVINGIQGKMYQTDLYRIPQAKIGPLVFNKPILQSNSKEFTKDSVFVKQGAPSLQEFGRIGWKLFQRTSVLLDVANETIAICDSINTLKAHGYVIENFSKTKLFTDRGILELEADTSLGPLRCALDTGASWNVVNTVTNTSVQESLWDPGNARIESTFIIEDQDFGPISFHGVPIQMSIPIKAILGMEFFRDHLIFIDFAEKQIYVSRICPDAES